LHVANGDASYINYLDLEATTLATKYNITIINRFVAQHKYKEDPAYLKAMHDLSKQQYKLFSDLGLPKAPGMEEFE
jgi:hypothetical protein